MAVKLCFKPLSPRGVRKRDLEEGEMRVPSWFQPATTMRKRDLEEGEMRVPSWFQPATTMNIAVTEKIFHDSDTPTCLIMNISSI